MCVWKCLYFPLTLCLIHSAIDFLGMMRILCKGAFDLLEEPEYIFPKVERKR